MTDNELLTLWHRHPELHEQIMQILEEDTVEEEGGKRDDT